MLRALATSHALSMGTAYFLVAAAAAVLVLLVWNADQANKELARLGAWLGQLADDHRDLCTRVNGLDAGLAEVQEAIPDAADFCDTRLRQLEKNLAESFEAGRRVGADLHEAATDLGDASQSMRAFAGALRLVAVRFQGRSTPDEVDDGQDEYFPS